MSQTETIEKTEREERWEFAKRWIHVYCSKNGPAWVHPGIVDMIEQIIEEEFQAMTNESIEINGKITCVCPT